MARYLFAPVGVESEIPEPGDFILTSGDYWSSKLIRWGQHLRFDAQFARYNHAALVIGHDGELAEALGQGVVESHVSKYRPEDYYVVKVGASEEDQEQIVRYAEAVLAARYRYGWLTIVSVTLTLLTGSSLVFGMAGTAICSGFVASGLVRAGYIFPVPPDHMTPADLADFFSVPIGERG